MTIGLSKQLVETGHLPAESLLIRKCTNKTKMTTFKSYFICTKQSKLSVEAALMGFVFKRLM